MRSEALIGRFSLIRQCSSPSVDVPCRYLDRRALSVRCRNVIVVGVPVRAAWQHLDSVGDCDSGGDKALCTHESRCTVSELWNLALWSDPPPHARSLARARDFPRKIRFTLEMLNWASESYRLRAISLTANFTRPRAQKEREIDFA